MATVTIRATAICAGGDHATVDLTKGGQTRSVKLNTPELRSAVTLDDIEVFCKLACRLKAEGLTVAQFKTVMLAGFDVTV